MTYIVNEACIKCKYMDCVEVCPVDCFYEGENMLVIHPDECIDCGVCEPECPPEAILPDTDPGADAWLEMNTLRMMTDLWMGASRRRRRLQERRGQVRQILQRKSGCERLALPPFPGPPLPQLGACVRTYGRTIPEASGRLHCLHLRNTVK